MMTSVDDDLGAVAAVVAAVTVFAFVVRIFGNGDLEVGAGQIIEEDIVVRSKEVAPTLVQVGEELVFEREDVIQALVEPVDFGQTEVAAGQVGQGGALEPFAVEMPLGARGQ